MKIARTIIAAFALIAIGAFAAFLAGRKHEAPEAQFVTLSGERFSTSELRGKVTVINFWATWCPDCMREMPRLADEYRKFSSRGYETIAVAIHDRPDRVAAYAHEKRLPFKVALDLGESVSRRFGNVHITPTIFVLDRRGRVLRRYEGEPRWEDFDRVIERALEEPSS